MDHPVTRLLTLLELLQTYRRLSGAEIARRLEVAPRTVRRYIATLHEIGIPIDSEAGRLGGYRLRPGYKLPPLMLTDEEALAVVLGLLAGRRLGLVAASSAAEGALAKLDRVLPDALRQRVHATQETIGMGLGQGMPVRERVDPGFLLTLGAAVHDERRVQISYRSANGEKTDRAVHPYGVVFQSGRWYLVGWDLLRRGIRTFRLDRVLAVEVTEQSFARPVGFNAVEHVQESIAGAPWAWSVEVVLALSMQEARRRVSPTVGMLVQERDGVRLTMGADNLSWASRYLVGLGCGFTVLKPAQLRDALRELAAALVRNANQTARKPSPTPSQT